MLWTVDLDADGERTAVDLRRARVRSRAQLDYEGVQRAVDDGSATGALALLRRGRHGCAPARDPPPRRLRPARCPTRRSCPHGDGWTLELRAPLAVERQNAQLSLLAGLAAADLMLGAGVGPAAHAAAARAGRARARCARWPPALGVAWPAGVALGDVLDGLDAASRRRPRSSRRRRRCCAAPAYVAFDGAAARAAGARRDRRARTRT